MLSIEDYILSNKEIELLKLISRTGFYVIAYKDKFKLSKNTLYSCVNKGLIKKENGQFIFTKYLFPYTLTEKGTELVSKLLMVSPYKTKLNQSNHDYALGNIYLSLSPKEKESWVTETRLNSLYPNISVIDALYTSIDNKRVGVEVLTNNYSESTISGKKDFINKYCDKGVIFNVDRL